MAYEDELFIITQTAGEDNSPNLVDPALQLPHHILHYIFSYLSFHDLFHVRLVNKNWYLNTPTYFKIHFNECLFRNKNPTYYSLNEFELRDSIRSSIDTIKNKLINAEKRVLHVEFINGERVRHLTKLLEEYNFHEVYFRTTEYDYKFPYILQSKCLNVLHLNKGYLDKHVLCDEVAIPTLKELKLKYFNLSEETLSKYIHKFPNIRVLSLVKCYLDKHVLCDEEVTMPTLKELKLEWFNLSEETLSKFIHKFPNIRVLSMVKCWGINSIVLTNLACLEKLYVNVSDSSSFTNIQVIAPRLQVFHFILRNKYPEFKNVVTMDIRACKMLREFHLNCTKFPNGLDPRNLCSDFPHLETLLLGPCWTRKPIKTSLRKLILSIPKIYECTRKTLVSSPNLSYFEYKGITFQPYLAPSKLLETNYTIVLVPKIHEIMKRAWFLKWRSHLENFSNHNTTLEIRIKTSLCHPSSKPSGRAPTQPLHYIKHLKVDMNKLIYQEEHLMRYIIDNLLWMSHPNTLTLSIPTSFSPTAIGVIKKLYGRRNRNCCSSTHDKCWRHFLKYFEVKEEEEETKKHPGASSSLYPWKVKEDEKMLTKLTFIFFWKQKINS
ncbi:uncharacterized protein LOC107014248 [Solanum pennellii]|uniref:Uncharacterized protein LOC107014248 n=1 Tax=Solanum pennellii TaxID=28526 RepID=A0ABM1GDI4_SOLPN|nr:uncharacterized protein LOC107014248 [Solanum pennellii]